MDLNLLIGSEQCAAHQGATFTRTNPLTGDVVTQAAAASAGDAVRAVEAAAQAFPAWSATSPGEKRAKLLKAAEIMEARQADFIERMVDETGATPGWAGFNVMVAASILREAASLTTGSLRRGGRDRSLERADYSGHPCHCNTAGVWQYGDS